MKWICSLLLLCSIILSSCHDYSLSSSPQHYVSSDILDTEWYAQAVLVDKQSHNNVAFLGMQCGLERVRFQVAKDRLLAFRSVGKAQEPSTGREPNSLVAAFHINRKLVTNSGVYFDIDWSRNLVPHLECNGWLQSIATAYIDNAHTAPSDPYRIVVRDNYMETTVSALVEPEEEACSMVSTSSCVSALYRVKFSFKKIPDSDYQKRTYPDFETFRYGFRGDKICLEGEKDCDKLRELWLYSDAQKTGLCDPLKDNLDDCYAPHIKMNAQFGFFRTEIFNFDRKKGFNEQQHHQFINRWNIWQNSHDEKGNPIALSDRIPKKIVYYLNPGFPEHLYDTTQAVAKEWSLALANVVAKLKDQCTFGGVLSAERLQSNQQALLAKGFTALTKNNYKEACNVLYNHTKNNSDKVFFTGKAQEIIDYYGDLFEIRRNNCSIDTVKKYLSTHTMSYILIENSIATIEEENIENICALLAHEAEKRGAEPFLWQQPGDLRYSFINGIQKPESAGLLGYGPSAVDPVSGEIISAHANIYLATIKAYATRSVLTMEKIDKLHASAKKIKKDSLKEENIDKLHVLFSSIKKPSFNTIYASQQASHFKDAIERLIGEDNSVSLSGNDDTVISSLIALQRHDHHDGKKETFYGERSACFLAHGQSLPYERLRDELRHASFDEKIARVESQVVKGVMLHEIGHTLGLRHNFKGAKDALNYPPQFWGIASEGLENRPGFHNEELRSASIMDYHKYFNSDFMGLGMYDYAALLFGYGEKVEVFDEDDGPFVPRALVSRLGLMDYHDFPALFSGAESEAKVVEHIAAVNDAVNLGNKAAYIDMKKLHLQSKSENIFKRKYLDFDIVKENMFTKLINGKKMSFTPVPYGFCTDGQVRGSDLLCRPFVYGASPSELVEDAIKNYEQALLLKKLGLVSAPARAVYLNAIYNQVYVPFLQAFQMAAAIDNQEIKKYPLYHDYVRATKLGFNLISRVLQSVEAGEYCKNSDGFYVPKADATCNDKITIDAFSGHAQARDSIDSKDDGQDFSNDKIMALFALVHGQSVVPHLAGAQAGASLYHIFRPQLIKLFSNFYTDNWQAWAPTLKADQDGNPVIEYHDVFFTSAPGTLKIQPSFSRTLKDYAMLFSMAGLSNPHDYHLDFFERARIGIEGAWGKGRIDPSVEKITFTDPITGVTYQAFAADDKELSLGYTLLKDAKQFTADGPDAGPWFVAKSQLMRAQEKWAASRSSSNLSMHSFEENEIERLGHEYERLHKQLKEKLRVIHKVFQWSNKL